MERQTDRLCWQSSHKSLEAACSSSHHFIITHIACVRNPTIQPGLHMKSGGHCFYAKTLFQALILIIIHTKVQLKSQIAKKTRPKLFFKFYCNIFFFSLKQELLTLCIGKNLVSQYRGYDTIYCDTL